MAMVKINVILHGQTLYDSRKPVLCHVVNPAELRLGLGSEMARHNQRLNTSANRLHENLLASQEG